MSAYTRKRVFYHETSDVCEGLPDLLHRFPLRALLVAMPGERVVLPAGKKPSELALLNRLGFGPRPEDIIYVAEDGSIDDGDEDLEGAEVLPFSGTTQKVRDFAVLHGAVFAGPSRDACVEANSKRTFQYACEAARMHGIVLGPGGTLVPSGPASRSKVEEAARMTAYCRGKAIVKGAHSASGLQQRVFSRGDEISLHGLPDDLVVQEWFDHDSSPSLNCELSEDGPFRIVCATDQILDGQHHAGNIFMGEGPRGIAPWAIDRMHAIAVEVCRLYGATGRIGYWGPLGIDFMVHEATRTVLASEVNARVTAPWYPIAASRRHLGTIVPFVLRSYSLRPGTRIEDIEDALNGCLFRRDGHRGVIPFCFVPEHGFIYGVTFSPDPCDLADLTNAVDRRLALLAP